VPEVKEQGADKPEVLAGFDRGAAMIEQYLIVPDVDDTADHDDYNGVMDYLKGAVGTVYRGKVVRIVIREVRKKVGAP